MKVRELIQKLKEAGAAPERTNGSHQVWKTLTGQVIVVTINHMNNDACHEAVRAARRAGVKVA